MVHCGVILHWGMHSPGKHVEMSGSKLNMTCLMISLHVYSASQGVHTCNVAVNSMLVFP